MTTITMSKRMMITLPDSVYTELDDWAKTEGRPVSNLAAFLLESAIRNRITIGKKTDETTTAKHEGQKND